MKKYRLPIVFALSFAAVLLATSAFAQDDASRRWMSQQVIRSIVARVEVRLNLTPDQREQAKAILKTEEPTILALAERARQQRDELSAMPTFDEDRARELAQKYAATDADIVVERTKIRLQLRAILTDAQRQQIDQLRAAAGAHLGERLDSIIEAL